MNKPRVVIVSGGTRGIGAEISKRFLSAGDTVFCTYKQNHDAAKFFFDSLSEHHKNHCHLANFSAHEPESVKEFFKKFDESFDHIDVLINNAGSMKGQLTASVSEQSFDLLINDNLKSTFFITQQAFKRMAINKNGKIINLSSIAAQCAQAGQSVYAAAKGGIEGLTKAWAIEFAPYNIKVNAIAPGLVESGMIEQTSNAIINEQIQLTPLGRLASANEVAAVAFWLASNDADFITGQVIALNGGVYI